jgi:hypothetical protein
MLSIPCPKNPPKKQLQNILNPFNSSTLNSFEFILNSPNLT